METRETPTTLLPGFVESAVVSGLSRPTAMEFSPDGRLFALEQGGNVKLVRADGTTWTALQLSTDSSGERGLLGIAFDPNYAANHYVYVYYTSATSGPVSWASGVHNQISRFTVDDSNLQQPVFTSEAPILDLDSLVATNHNGGAIHFGTDGMLYAAVGDNMQTFVQGGNKYRAAQTLSNLLGKQLRIDVSKFNQGVATRDDETVGHLIPSNNPFVGTATGINQLIYALGLRNPFTFAVQPGSGVQFINDVGELTWEEINRGAAGANYGWSGGSTDGFGQTPPGPGTYQDPVLAYNHTGGPAGGGIAIVGGAFYDPAAPQFPEIYDGKYFYGDLGGNWIRVLDPAQPGSAANPDTSQAFATSTSGSLRDIKIDAAGSLYYLAGNGGVIRKISYSLAPGDAGFERPSAGPAGADRSYIYRPTGSAWTFAGAAGISANGSGFTSGNPAAPQGAQVAFLQGGSASTISQTVTGWTAGDYQLTFLAAQRANWQSRYQDFRVLVDGMEVARIRPAGTTYRSYATPGFNVAAGSHTIAFQAINTAGGDNTAFLDDIEIQRLAVSQPGDTGFEQPSAGRAGADRSYIYRPTGSAWTFAGAAGISANGSGFTSGNPAAPQGAQVAFLQGGSASTISQTVTGWTAGTYVINFKAAQRANYQASLQDFDVLIDGALVATIQPTDTTYRVYSTSSFTVSAGSHTIAFRGRNSRGGDNTAFLDDIQLRPA